MHVLASTEHSHPLRFRAPRFKYQLGSYLDQPSRRQKFTGYLAHPYRQPHPLCLGCCYSNGTPARNPRIKRTLLYSHGRYEVPFVMVLMKCANINQITSFVFPTPSHEPQCHVWCAVGKGPTVRRFYVVGRWEERPRRLWSRDEAKYELSVSQLEEGYKTTSGCG